MTDPSQERRADDNRYVEILVMFEQINGKFSNINLKIDEVIKPAVSQVYVNKEAILTLNNNASNAKDSRGRLISYAALILSLVVTMISWVRLSRIH